MAPQVSAALVALSALCALAAAAPRVGSDVFIRDHLPADHHVVEATRLLDNGDVTGRFATRTTNERDVHGHRVHARTARFALQAFGRNFDLVLERNDDLIHPDYVAEHVNAKNEVISEVRGAENCYYLGHVAGIADSSVAVSTCDGLHGLVRVRDEEFFVEPAHTRFAGIRASENKHLIYRTNEVRGMNEQTHTCGVDGESLFDDHSHAHGHGHAHADGHSDHSDDATSMTGHEDLDMAARMERQLHASENWIEVALANDNRRYRNNGANTESNTLTVMNLVYDRYADANFNPTTRCVMIRQRTFSEGDPISVVSDSSTLLNNWCAYRQSSYSFGDNGVLISGIDFAGSTIGLAWVGTMCTSRSSCNINQENRVDHATAATIAHEIGHNMNLPHDSTGAASACPQSGLIMQAAICGSCGAVTEFSSCSKSLISQFYDSKGRSQLGCLENEPESGWTRPVCGNGVLEEGEECDSNSACCTPSCELVNGAICDATQECCSNQCVWDLGAPCGSGGACYTGGQCTTYEDACINALSGFSVGNVDSCGSTNPGGCGYLHCDIQQFGGCTSLQSIRANGLDQFAPDGMPCNGGYCENRQCVPYVPGANACPYANGQQCNGRGTCDDGDCQCQGGWSGDSCEIAPPCPRFGGLECNNHGNCVDGVCECTDRWTGDACEFVPQCPKVGGVDCNGQGLCREGVCECAGSWTGDACDEPNCGSCSGRGSCVLRDGQPACQCNNGWRGDECELPDCPGEPDCSNNGNCEPPFFIFPARCECDNGFTGDDCSEIVCPGNPLCATNSARPTARPTQPPTARPTQPPTARPTQPPTPRPTARPTQSVRPDEPTLVPPPPTDRPTDRPTARPTQPPTDRPTQRPTDRPTDRPTPRPTDVPVPECTLNCNNGRCDFRDGQQICICESSWKGDRCNVDDCPGEPDCSDQGSCGGRFFIFPPYCTCDSGFEGDDCSQIKCPENPVCSTGGDDDDDDDNTPPTGDDDDDTGNGVGLRLVVSEGPSAGTVVSEGESMRSFRVRVFDATNRLVTNTNLGVGIAAADNSASLGLEIVGGSVVTVTTGEIMFDNVQVRGPRGATFQLKFFSTDGSVDAADSVPLVIEPCPANTRPLDINPRLCGCARGFGGVDPDATTESCQLCPVGTYKAEVANALCEQCPFETSTPEPGAVSRADCACRTFAGADPNACTFVFEPVGPEGGDFDVPGVSISIPDGSLPEGEKNFTVVHVTAGDAGIPTWLKLVSSVRQFGPSGQVFDPAVEVTFSVFTPDVENWDRVAIYSAEDGSDEWVEVESTVDEAAGSCTGLMPHFSRAAAFEVLGNGGDDDGDDAGDDLPLVPIFIGCGAAVGLGLIGGGAYMLKKRRAASNYKNFDDWGGSGHTAATPMSDMSARSVSAPVVAAAPRNLPTAPLPRGWQEVHGAEGTYYSNSISGETSWTRPV